MNTSQVTDRSVDLLLQELFRIDGNVLLVADENWCQADLLSAINATAGKVTLISNRFDIARDAKAAGIPSHFNDFDFLTFPQATLTRCFSAYLRNGRVAIMLLIRPLCS